jgi:YHS domain-containing protein
MFPMNLIRKSTWALLFLGGLIGCSGEEEAAVPPPAASKPNSPPSETTTAPPVSPSATGESKKGDEAPKIEGPKAENTKSDGGAVVLTAAEIAAVKELPEAEQAVASQQAVCPVSNHHLGSMGKPLKVSAEGRTFYLCCDSCEDKVKSDPKTVIANLDKRNNGK